MNSDYRPVRMSLGEIRKRLGLDNDLDAYFLERQRELYAASKHKPMTWTDFDSATQEFVERPFTVDEAMAWANRYR
jgi:hypothetical protein